LSPLFTIRYSPDMEDLEDILDTIDNVCGAIARIMLSDWTVLPLKELLPVFLSNLPLKHDFDENQAVYSAIIFLLQQKNEIIAQFMPQVIDVLSKALTDSNVPADIQTGIGVTLKGLITTYTQLQPVVTALAPTQRQAVQNLFS